MGEWFRTPRARAIGPDEVTSITAAAWVGGHPACTIQSTPEAYLRGASVARQ